jgi:hypothetical protein
MMSAAPPKPERLLASPDKEKAMIKPANLAALLAMSSIAALPACSMFGGGNNSNHASYSSPQSPALSQNMIQQVQTRLQQAGNYNGTIDGRWGPSTEAGVRSYQQQHNLNATGQLDGDTLASLNLGGTNTTLGSTQPNVSTQPANQNLGSNNIPLANRITPADNATQPNTSTPH